MQLNEPKKDKPISVRLPREVYDRLKERADEERRSLSNYLLLLIERDLEHPHFDFENTGSSRAPYPVLSHSQAHALRDLIIASQKVAEEHIEYIGVDLKQIEGSTN